MFDHLPIASIIVSFVAILFSLSVHEASHATMAYWLNDDTAKRQGRMTLNPVAHISLMGTVLVPLALAIMNLPVFGWAKPVYVNTDNLTKRFNSRVGNAIVAAAGPVSNILLVLVFTVGLALFIKTVFPQSAPHKIKAFWDAFHSSVEQLRSEGLYSSWQILALGIMSRLIIINSILAVFNLIPLGPLDGANILRGMLPFRFVYKYDRMQMVFSVLLLFIILFGALDPILGPVPNLVYKHFVLPVSRIILGV